MFKKTDDLVRRGVPKAGLWRVGPAVSGWIYATMSSAALKSTAVRLFDDLQCDSVILGTLF